jgi:protein-tyrosine phosphatase
MAKAIYMKVVLFLCTGNYYRSRFAEEMFNFLAPVECPGWTAVSRGIAVDLGINNVGPIARSTALALEKRGITCNPRLARMPLQAEIADLESADHIVALKEAEHFPLMRERFPSWLRTSPARIEYWHIHDVDQMPPEQGLPLIAERLQGLMQWLSSKDPKQQ